MNTPNSSAPTRRSFLAGVGLAPLAAGSNASPVAPAGGVKVVDIHGHLRHHSDPNWMQSDRAVIDACDKLGIDQTCCSILTPRRPSTPDGFRQCNQWVYEAMQRFPGRVRGYCYVNPGYREALDEVRRCIGRGFFGVKLYNEYLISEPVLYPLVELSIELGIPILEHAGHPGWLDSAQPRISDGSAFAEIAKRYPEATIICAHICGGGDWEWEIKALRNSPSIFLDTAGSVADEGVVEKAVETLGVDRIVFACDMSFTTSVGRLRSANLSQADKDKIYGLNFQRILSRRKA